MTFRIIFIFGFLLSCYRMEYSEDVFFEKRSFNNEIIGKWNVLFFTSGFKEPELYKAGDIIWEFQDGSLKVQFNTLLSGKQIPVFVTGQYNYEHRSNKITLMTSQFDWSFEKGYLILSHHPELAGPIIKLKRAD